jgi:nucleotide-binding universal stress UspA family protein
MFKRLLLCYDGSDETRHALIRACDFAKLMGSEVSVLLIVPSTLNYGTSLARASGHDCTFDAQRRCRESLDETVSTLTARGVIAAGYLATGDVIDVIVNYANKLDSDLIVIGHYPHAGASRWWSPSQRASLAERAPCSVFISVATSN